MVGFEVTGHHLPPCVSVWVRCYTCRVYASINYILWMRIKVKLVALTANSPTPQPTPSREHSSHQQTMTMLHALGTTQVSAMTTYTMQIRQII